MQLPRLMDILAYILEAGGATVTQMFVLVGIGMILGFLIHHLCRTIAVHAVSLFRGCTYHYLFLIPGTAIHEFSHLLFAWLFRFKIYKVVFFQCKPNDPYGGYVERSGPRNYLQKIGHFFIGIAPILIGSLVIYALSRILLGPGVFSGVEFSLEVGESLSLLAVVGRLYESIVVTTMTVFGRLLTLRSVPTWQTWLFLYLAYSISNSMHLSDFDLEHAMSGLTAIAVVLLAANILTMSGGEDVLLLYILQLSQMYGILYTIMLFVLSLNVIAAVIVVPLGMLFGRGV